MHKVAYIHQFDQLGEKSVREIANTLRLGGISEVRAKSHQACTFLGKFDRSPLAFHSLDDVRQRRAEFAREGITMRGWSVPMGVSLHEEVEFTAAVAEALGGEIELDVEPYGKGTADPADDFWTGDPADFAPFVGALSAEGIRIEIDFDARPDGYLPFGLQFGQALKLAARVWTQSYWTTFGEDAADTVRGALDTLAALGVPRERQGIIAPWNGWGSYRRVADLCRQQGVNHLAVWKMGEMGPPGYEALAAIPSTAEAPVGVDWAAVTDSLNGIAHYKAESDEHLRLARVANDELWTRVLSLKAALEVE